MVGRYCYGVNKVCMHMQTNGECICKALEQIVDAYVELKSKLWMYM